MIVNVYIPLVILFLILLLIIIKLSFVGNIPGNKVLILLESMCFHGTTHSSDRKVIQFYRKSDNINRVMYTLIGVVAIIDFVLRTVH